MLSSILAGMNMVVGVTVRWFIVNCITRFGNVKCVRASFALPGHVESSVSLLVAPWKCVNQVRGGVFGMF